jgi:hypothetical protein
MIRFGSRNAEPIAFNTFKWVNRRESGWRRLIFDE